MTTAFEAMKYGPLGDAVEAARPWTEGDPIGVLAAGLSMFSAAVNGHVAQANGRPCVVWTVLVGRSRSARKGFAYDTAKAAVGKSVEGFLKSRTMDGVASGPALVSKLFELVENTRLAEDGVDGRTLMVADEWASILRRANRDDTYYDQMIRAWDGKAISNVTKKDGKVNEERVDNPLLGFHGHIQPGRWRHLVKPEFAASGFFNRVLPVTVDASQSLPSRKDDPLSNIRESTELTRAYKWAREEPRVIRLSAAAADLHDAYREEVDDRLAALPEDFAVLVERADEQLLRVACTLTAAERKTTVSPAAWKAARAFVEYSIKSVEGLSERSKAKVTKSLPELVRELLVERYDGEASATLMLRALGTRCTAASLKTAVDGMDDVEMVKGENPGRGAKPTLYRLVKPEEAVAKAPEPSRPQQAPAESTPTQGEVSKPAARPLRVVTSSRPPTIPAGKSAPTKARPAKAPTLAPVPVPTPAPPVNPIQLLLAL